MSEPEDGPFTLSNEFIQVNNIERKDMGVWKKGNMRIYKQPAPANYRVTFAKEGVDLEDEMVKATASPGIVQPGYQIPSTVKKCRKGFVMNPKKGRVNFIDLSKGTDMNPGNKIVEEINVKDPNELNKLLEGLKTFGWLEYEGCYQQGGRTRKRKYSRKKTRKAKKSKKSKKSRKHRKSKKGKKGKKSRKSRKR